MDNTALYPFTLAFTGTYERFPFMFDNAPVAAGRYGHAPACIISGLRAGNMTLNTALEGSSRAALFSALGIPPQQVYRLHQTHSRTVYTLGAAAAEEQPLPPPENFTQQGDGMVCLSGAAVLAVTVADCLPVFLYDTEHGYYALLHSGWKGTGIVLNALAIMRRAGSRPQAIAAVLGPCIQSCCYQVDSDRAEQFTAEFGGLPPLRLAKDCPAAEPALAAERCPAAPAAPAMYALEEVVRRHNGSRYISLQAANARLLAAHGVRNIACCTNCTFTDRRLGSYRREGPQSFTRMLALAGPV